MSNLIKHITELYKNNINPNFIYDKEYNISIVYQMWNYFNFKELDIDNFWEHKSKIKNKIKERADGCIDRLWTQPAVMLLYPLIAKYKRQIIEKWAYGNSLREIEKIYVDLGIPYESR